jgi:hypothetical protein
MSAVPNGPARGSAWFSGAKYATAVGAITSLVFGLWWFGEVSGHCGVVRFYEYLFGVLLLGGWLIGTAIGWRASIVSLQRAPTGVPITGLLAVLLINGLLVAGSAALYYQHLAGSLALRSNQELQEMLMGDRLDARVLAAHKLGERRSSEALPLLADLLEDDRQDINLRHNASFALGNTCAPPHPPEADCERALVALVNALKGPEEFLPVSIVEALGKIGDSRAIPPLVAFVGDSSRSIYDRENAARALARIGGQEARAALETVRTKSDDEDLKVRIDRILETMDSEA